MRYPPESRLRSYRRRAAGRLLGRRGAAQPGDLWRRAACVLAAGCDARAAAQWPYPARAFSPRSCRRARLALENCFPADVEVARETWFAAENAAAIGRKGQALSPAARSEAGA